MPPALALARALRQTRHLPTRPPSTRLFCSPRRCSLSPSSLLQQSTQQQQQQQQRSQSTTTNPRTTLRNTLLALHAHSPHQIHLPRLQLALRNLAEQPGHESIRLAVLSPSSPTKTTTPPPKSSQTTTETTTARQLLRLLLADPLSPSPAAWETALLAEDAAGVVLRVGPLGDRDRSGKTEAGLLKVEGHDEPASSEVLCVSAPGWNEAGLEVLVVDSGAVGGGDKDGGGEEEAVMVPGGTTAVHMALVVGDGVLGAAEVLRVLPVGEAWGGIVAGAIDFKGIGGSELADSPLVVGVNVDAGQEGLELLRADVQNVKQYETLWARGNVSRVSEWLRKGALPSEEGVMKAPVRALIGSLLRGARAAVQEEEARDLSVERQGKLSPGAVAHLDRALADWAQDAHQELQQQLDAAFTTRPWSKLGWWKLVWRADDVAMVTSEMLALRFLPRAEQGIIYLAGRIQGAGVGDGSQGPPRYIGPALPRPDDTRQDSTGAWPTHIPFTKNYLQEKTVPALQALAQKLVVQSGSLAGLSTTLAGLSYLSGLGTFECGAIAALGIALSCKRLQDKWDAAREYWEGEVREEGRKAIRATEASVAEVLDKAAKTPKAEADMTVQLQQLRKAEELIAQAEEALARIK